MKRFFFWCSDRGCCCSSLVFLGLNLFDSRTAPGLAGRSAGVPLAANLEPGNGFFIVWGFAEPPETDPLARRLPPPGAGTVQRARPTDYLFRSPYGQLAGAPEHRLRAGTGRGPNVYFPKLPGRGCLRLFRVPPRPDRGAAAAFRPAAAALPAVLQAGELEDFTPLGWECPGPQPAAGHPYGQALCRLPGAGRPGRRLAGGRDDLLEAAGSGIEADRAAAAP